jgi:hypothetical protein
VPQGREKREGRRRDHVLRRRGIKPGHLCAFPYRLPCSCKAQACGRHQERESRAQREREEAAPPPARFRVHRRRVQEFGPVSLAVHRGLIRGPPCYGLAAGALGIRHHGTNTAARPPNSVGRFVHCWNQGKNSSVEFAIISATHRSFLIGGFVCVCAFGVHQWGLHRRTCGRHCPWPSGG